MKRAALIVLATCVVGLGQGAFGRDWTNWRGPNFNGTATSKNLPATWSDTENVVWSTDLPGEGAATPAVAAGRVFLSAMERDTMKLLAMGLDRATGKILWRHETGEGRAPRKRGFENTMAAPSPVTDGKLVCFLFGSGYLTAFDLDGKQLWQRDLVDEYGSLDIGWGYASSPLLFDGRLFVQVLRAGESYLLAIDPKTGENLWRHVRPDDARAESEEAYTTPMPFDNQGRMEILIVGADCVTAHDPATGDEYWRWCGLNPNDRGNFRIISGAVAGPNGMLYCTSPQGNPLHALRVKGNDVEEVWTMRRPTPDVTTPLVYGGRLYVLDGKRRQRLACIEPETGDVHWEEELDTPTYIRASPTGADGKIYIMDVEGNVVVLKEGEAFEVLGRMEMGSYPARSTIVVDDDQLLVRTAERLVCIGKPAPEVDARDGDVEDVQAAREKAFAKLMTGAELVGYFTTDGQPKDRDLQEDRYEISKAAKLGGTRWQFDVRIEYGETDVTVPLRLDVEWAGDTPVITLTDMKIPALGTFTARVLFHRGKYAGTWDAGDHGGEMFGRVITKRQRGAGPGGGTGANWPSFRGRFARGVADGHPTPVEWSVSEGRNVRWKTPVAGLAHSSPVVWGDRLFVTSAERDGEADLKVGLYGSIDPVPDDSVHRFVVHCLDKRSGEILWSRQVNEAVPRVKRHPKGSHAASTPATDGEHVVAFFGSEGLYCLDMNGNELWKKDLGLLDAGYYLVPEAQWGFASSPVIHDGLVVVQCDVQGDSFLAAFDVETGEEAWRTVRDEVPTWGSPTIDARPGRTQVIVNGWYHIGGYDLRTGAELWKMRGGGDIPVPTPVVAHDLAFITNAHGRQAPIYAIPVDAEGDLSDAMDERLAWWTRRRGNYMQTPIVYGDELYCCRDNGVLTCYDARSGDEKYSERLGAGNTGFTASAVAADGKVYFTSEVGEIHVVQAGTEFALLAVNDMEETTMATPAVSEGALFFRTRGHVVAIGNDR